MIHLAADGEDCVHEIHLAEAGEDCVNEIHLAAHDLAKLDLRYAAGVRRVKSPADMAIANDKDDDDDDGDDSDGVQDDDDDGGEVSLKDCQQSCLIWVSSTLTRDQSEVFIER